MNRRRWIGVGAAALAVLAAMSILGRLAEPEPFPPPPASSFAFGVLGDAPYYLWEEYQTVRVIRQMNATELAFVLHVGDILWQPCDYATYRRRLGYFDTVRHPLVYTPGDNEWTDCWGRGAGGFDPLERLGRLREIFYPDPSRSLGGQPLAVKSQSLDPDWGEFVENALWAHRRIVFATVHIVGSANGAEPRAGRTQAAELERRRRTEAAAAWTRRAFAAAIEAGAEAVVIGFHANLRLELPLEDPQRLAYEPFVETLEEEAARFGRPVLLTQGGDHEYIVDRPLVRRTTGRLLDNVTRLQVPGSPEVGWVRVVVTAGAGEPFDFEVRTIPRWLMW